MASLSRVVVVEMVEVLVIIFTRGFLTSRLPIFLV